MDNKSGTTDQVYLQLWFHAIGTINFVLTIVPLTPRLIELKYQGVKEFHMLAHIGCTGKIMVFSPFFTYYHSSKGNK